MDSSRSIRRAKLTSRRQASTAAASSLVSSALLPGLVPFAGGDRWKLKRSHSGTVVAWWTAWQVTPSNALFSCSLRLNAGPATAGHFGGAMQWKGIREASWCNLGTLSNKLCAPWSDGILSVAS